MQARLNEASALLAQVDPDDLNQSVGRDVRFEGDGVQLVFLAEDFLTLLSIPNFYFHATTAYDILRMTGVPLGKRDFVGRPRFKA